MGFYGWTDGPSSKDLTYEAGIVAIIFNDRSGNNLAY